MSEETVAARAKLWFEGARPRTLGVGLTPVIVGTAAAEHATVLRTLGCLLVALGMQVGVNYANDHSDGRRGVDTAARVGPVRLVASGAASARAVATAAGISFAVAGLAGLALARVAGWQVLIVGVVSVAAAVLYSGGPKPYASAGLGEVFVFVFFGLVATAGTAYVQAGDIREQVWWSAVSMGLLAVAVLVANNLRDIPTDTAVGKRTLAVRLGDPGTRALYRAVVTAGLVLPLFGWLTGGMPVGALLALAAIPLAAGPLRAVGYARGPELVRVLIGTVLMLVQFGVFLAIGLWLS
ncbi:MAG: 1,4-dihydroxy-2-naphthoate polyprenyltransferase [Actinomycetota bacterium]